MASRRTSLLKNPEDEVRSAGGYSWILAGDATRRVTVQHEVEEHHDIHSSAIHIMARRGVTPAKVGAFLNPVRENSMLSPYGIRRMDKAVKYITGAMQKGEKIAVLGDYDVDGCTGTALLERFFHEVGVPIETYIPHRVNEGYGPNSEAIRKLHAQGVKLLITVDCGTTSYASLKLAKDLGMKVIVTDHHKPDKGTQYPEGAEIVNPNRKDPKCPPTIYKKYQVMTGEGVAFLLSEALFDRLENPEKGEKDWFASHPRPERNTLFEKLIVLASLGTHCDVAPITGINRWLMTEGLRTIEKWQADSKECGNPWPIPGLEQLVRVAGLKDRKITEDHYGFQIGPRLNAIGRMDQGVYAKNLLVSEDPQVALALAKKLDENNALRKETQKSILEEAMRQAEAQAAISPVIVVSGKGWHEGVIGIVAGKLKETYGKPCVVITIDEHGKAKGSARSIEGVDIGDAVIKSLHGEDALLTKGGGHMMAAGFSMEEEKIPAFQRYLNTVLAADVQKATAYRQLKIDDVISVRDMTSELVASYKKLGPFGRHNESPRIMLRDVSIVEGRVVGQNRDTLQMTLRDMQNTQERTRAVLFQKASQPVGIALRNPFPNEKLQLVGRVTSQEFQGTPQIQFEVEDAYFGAAENILPTRRSTTHLQMIKAQKQQQKERSL